MFVSAINGMQDADNHQQLVYILKRAEEMTGKKAYITLTDVVYHSVSNLAAYAEWIQIVALPKPQDHCAEPSCHNDFSYDANTDSYLQWGKL